MVEPFLDAREVATSILAMADSIPPLAAEIREQLTDRGLANEALDALVRDVSARARQCERMFRHAPSA